MKVFKKATFQTIPIFLILPLLILGGLSAYKAYLRFLLPSNEILIDMNFYELSKSLDEFRKKCGVYPTTSQGLHLLRYDPENTCKNYPESSFLPNHMPILNPWRKDYSYESDGKTYKLYTFNEDLKKSDRDYKVVFNEIDRPILTPYGKKIIKEEKIEKSYNFEYQRVTDDEGNIQFRIVRLDANSNLSSIGIKAGDRITKINNKPVVSFKEIQDAEMSFGFVKKIRISFLHNHDIYETSIDKIE